MTHSDLLLFGERLRNRRNALVLTQQSVADNVGISLRYYQMLERGKKSVSLDTLICLGTVLHTSLDYLLLGSPASDFEHPIVQLFDQLLPEQRDDALKILELYIKACQTAPSEKNN